MKIKFTDTDKKIMVKLLEYEVGSGWLLWVAFNDPIQELISRYYVWKVSIKYKRFILFLKHTNKFLYA